MWTQCSGRGGVPAPLNSCSLTIFDIQLTRIKYYNIIAIAYQRYQMIMTLHDSYVCWYLTQWICKINTYLSFYILSYCDKNQNKVRITVWLGSLNWQSFSTSPHILYANIRYPYWILLTSIHSGRKCDATNYINITEIRLTEGENKRKYQI